ncbi:hypothetical protein OF83DRAFT_675913 [Amylostereum chailletii]|nr:hypothetical protein OF83DRAFT_675913 [Amylostereum chailletii]
MGLPMVTDLPFPSHPRHVRHLQNDLEDAIHGEKIHFNPSFKSAFPYHVGNNPFVSMGRWEDRAYPTWYRECAEGGSTADVDAVHIFIDDPSITLASARENFQWTSPWSALSYLEVRHIFNPPSQGVDAWEGLSRRRWCRIVAHMSARAAVLTYDCHNETEARDSTICALGPVHPHDGLLHCQPKTHISWSLPSRSLVGHGQPCSFYPSLQYVEALSS